MGCDTEATRKLIRDIEKFSETLKSKKNASADLSILGTLRSLLREILIDSPDMEAARKLLNAFKDVAFADLKDYTIELVTRSLKLITYEFNDYEFIYKATKQDANLVRSLRNVLRICLEGKLSACGCTGCRRILRQCDVIFNKLEEAMEWMEAAILLKDENIFKCFDIKKATSLRYYLLEQKCSDCRTKLDTDDNFIIFSDCTHVLCLRCYPATCSAGGTACPQCRRKSPTTLESFTVSKMLALRKWRSKNQSHEYLDRSVPGRHSVVEIQTSRGLYIEIQTTRGHHAEILDFLQNFIRFDND
ncbi:uncharacterized protein LOC108664569 [Hyalella azteca]|uniref:Uncharacterized protein LOC108664569 n=1 Tax=Hyalella azteca TaxID=294128 RepID=A0A8B7MZH2_HYAAZ|nr:uncharacterized protein LOC108664569 [Hyalella azteca]